MPMPSHKLNAIKPNDNCLDWKLNRIVISIHCQIYIYSYICTHSKALGKLEAKNNTEKELNIPVAELSTYGMLRYSQFAHCLRFHLQHKIMSWMLKPKKQQPT